MALRSGDAAPDFTLPGTGGRDYTLSAERGRPVVLAFYPGDDTKICTEQLTHYNDDLATIAGVGATLWALSPQDVASHERFAGKYGFRFPLLADVDKAVGQAYGVVGPLGFYRRSIFVVDAAGTVAYVHRSVSGTTYVRPDAIRVAVEAAG